MKLLASVTALAGIAAAQYYEPHIPLDCYSKIQQSYGAKESNDVVRSDYDLLTGLDIVNHRVSSITACTDVRTRLITGITTVYAKYSGQIQSETTRMNLIGRMSGLTEFDDSANSGGYTLTADQEIAFEQYWYQEASPDNKEFYRLGTSLGNGVGSPEWQQQTTAIFQAADLNRDSSLTYDEAQDFYKNVRARDKKVVDPAHPSDYYQEEIDRAWEVASKLGSGTSITQQDYETVERIMESWYAAGKLEKTGYLEGVTGQKLSHTCSVLNLEADDRVTQAMVRSSASGVSSLYVQTARIPQRIFGDPAPETNPLYGYMNENWQRFDDNREFAGFWGTMDAVSGNLNSIGFVDKNTTCTSILQGQLQGRYNWLEPVSQVTMPSAHEWYSGDEADKAEAMDNIRTDIKNGNVPSHEHDDKAEPALIAVTVLVWVAVIVLLGVFAYQYCNAKKAGKAVGGGRFNNQ